MSFIFPLRLPPAVETQRDRSLVSGEEQSERVERVGGGDVRHDPSGGAAPAPQVRSASTAVRGSTCTTARRCIRSTVRCNVYDVLLWDMYCTLLDKYCTFREGNGTGR